MNFVCSRCHKHCKEIAGFEHNVLTKQSGYFCKACACTFSGEKASWREYNLVMPLPQKSNPKVRQTEEEKRFVEQQTARLKRELEEPEKVKKEWALFLKKYFNGPKSQE